MNPIAQDVKKGTTSGRSREGFLKVKMKIPRFLMFKKSSFEARQTTTLPETNISPEN